MSCLFLLTYVSDVFFDDTFEFVLFGAPKQRQLNIIHEKYTKSTFVIDFW